MTWLDRSSSSCYEEAEAVNHVVSNAPRTRHTCLPSSSYTVFHHTKTLRLGHDDKEEEEEEEDDNNNEEEVTLVLILHCLSPHQNFKGYMMKNSTTQK